MTARQAAWWWAVRQGCTVRQGSWKLPHAVAESVLPLGISRGHSSCYCGAEADVSAHVASDGLMLHALDAFPLAASHCCRCHVGLACGYQQPILRHRQIYNLASCYSSMCIKLHQPTCNG